MMKQYDSYKDSGVEWIGNIPSHWNLLRGKFSTKVVSGFPFNSDHFTYDEDEAYLPLIRIRDITNLTTEVRYKGDYPEEAVVNTGDVLIGMDGDFNISLWKGEKGLLNQRVCRLVETDRMDKKYAYYMLGFPLKCINDVTYSTTVKHLSTYDILGAILPVPPIKEQKEIVLYLDEKCGKIDKAIATQEKRVELLKEQRQNIITRAVTRGINPDAPLKETDIDWMSKVPDNWKRYRYKDIASLQSTPSEDENKIGLENIESKTGHFIESLSEFEGNGISFEVGDIIYGKLRPYLQKVWVATFAGNAVGDFFVFRPKNICDNKYLFYIMMSDGFTCSCNGSTFGAKMPRVSSDFIRSMHLYIPPLSEQQEIVTYIETKTARLDKSIEKAEHQIELLQELKQSIITEVVTGKRKVC